MFTKQQEVENAYHRFHFSCAAWQALKRTHKHGPTTPPPQRPSPMVWLLIPLVVPLLHGNDLGALAGRLCKHAVTVADSPMRTTTGTMVGLGATPVDMDSVPLPSSNGCA